MPGKNFFHRQACFFDNIMVHIEKGKPCLHGKLPAHRALAATHKAAQHEVSIGLRFAH